MYYSLRKDTSLAKMVNGRRIWVDPNVAFAGDPREDETIWSNTSVYAPELSRVANLYGRARDITGASWTEIEQAIANDNPVVMWGTWMNEAPRVQYRWYTPDGTRIDDVFIGHAFLLVGYDASSVFIADPGK